MYPFFVASHVVICSFLILVIMLQPGKSGDPGLAFGGGGGSSNLFGPRGPAGLLQRVTTVFAGLYMVTTVALALYSNRSMLANANVDQEMELLEQEEGAPPPAEPVGASPPVDEAPAMEVVPSGAIPAPIVTP
jgi:preprotein translocase subunit SecG